MNKSESIASLAQALSKAQAEMGPAYFNASNPFLKNRYADLGSLISASKDALAKNGLSLSQLTTSDNGNVGVTTLLAHESGEWMSSTITLPLGDEKGKSTAQVAGSIITYLRRYSYASVLGMYAEEETDGEDGHRNNGNKKPVTVDHVPTSAMDIQTAEAVTNSEGMRYGDIDSEKLAYMFNSIANLKKKTDEHKQKQDAISVILTTRAGK